MENEKVTPELKEKLLLGFSDYLDSQTELCVDNVLLLEMLPKILKLQNTKGTIYGRSYCRHGDMSIFFNIERKFDRISTIMERVMKCGQQSLHSSDSSTPTETFLDTIVDIGVYGLLWAAFIKDTYPNDWEKFLTSNEL